MRHHSPFTSDRDLEPIFDGVANRTLPKAAWTHPAHFAAALWLCARHPDLDMRPIIRAYNEATGVENTDSAGYHETITLASLRAARAALGARPAEPPHRICNALLASPLGDPDWLLAYWSRDRLFSVAARRAWLDSDLAAFPF